MTMILAGIDEAGYGPILGPLVIAGTGFRANAPDIREQLGPSVVRAGERGNPGAFVVDDSKRVYRGRTGIRRLERSVSAFLDLHQKTRLLSGLFDPHSFDTQFPPENPWYCDAAPQIPPAEAGPDLNRLADTACCAGISLPAIGTHVCFEEDFNQRVNRGANKSDILFDGTMVVLKGLLAAAAENEEVTVVLDRQGGRIYYAEPLSRVFPDRSIVAVRETNDSSEYRIGEKLRLFFMKEADQHCFETALASMFAKYIRERYVGEINRFWQLQVPGLKATAGYVTDGRRFLSDIAEKQQELGVAMHRMVRSR